MYCHYGPKIKLYCFCHKDERNMIEFVDYPMKNMDVYEGGAQTIPSIEREKRMEGEQIGHHSRHESNSANRAQIEGLSEEPGSQINLSEIALFARQTDEGSNQNLVDQYPNDGDEFDDTHSESGSLYGGAESPGKTLERTRTGSIDDKRCPSASSYRSWDQTDETEELEKRFNGEDFLREQPVTAGGFWRGDSYDQMQSPKLYPQERSESFAGIQPRSPPRSRPQAFIDNSISDNRMKRSASVMAGYKKPKEPFYEPQQTDITPRLRDDRVQSAVTYSEITPRSQKPETPGRGGGKETKRFPRRRVLSRTRYFE